MPMQLRTTLGDSWKTYIFNPAKDIPEVPRLFVHLSKQLVQHNDEEIVGVRSNLLPRRVGRKGLKTAF
jgi:hypothetical protein